MVKPAQRSSPSRRDRAWLALSRYGLRIQVVGLMTLIAVAVVAAAGAVWLRLMERNFVRTKEITGSTIHASVQSLVALEWEGRSTLVMGVSDQNRLTDIIQTLANYQPLSEIFIVDTNRVIAAHLRYDRIGEKYSDPGFERVFHGLTTDFQYLSPENSPDIDPDDEVVLTAPLFVDKQVVGAVRLVLPMGDMADAIRGTRRVLVLYTLLTVLLTTLLGSFALMRLIVKPVAELAGATARITEGDYEHKVPIRSENEIGVLARALANLHLTLRDRERRLGEQKESLRTAADRLERAEAEVIQQDRLVYLGRVAAGVAHEVGNPLGAVNNYLGVLSGSDTLADEDAEIVERIQHEIDRVDKIMRELLDFSRQRRVEPVPTPLPAFLRECVGILKDQRQIDRFEVRFEFEDEAGPVLSLDRAQFKQVIFNVLLNARDAMGESGTVHVAVRQVAYDDQVLLESALPAMPGADPAAFTDLARRGIVFSQKPRYAKGEALVVVSIGDDGPGLDADKVQRVFEPFFTTKSQGRGTGLGLAICQRIVENFGGVLRFESRSAARGRPTGTVLSIVLPEQFQPVQGDQREDLLAILGEA